MKKIVLNLTILLLFIIPAFAQSVIEHAPAATNVRNAKYPQILADHRVIFRVKAPEAQKVQVDLGRKYDMVKDTGGLWLFK